MRDRRLVERALSVQMGDHLRRIGVGQPRPRIGTDNPVLDPVEGSGHGRRRGLHGGQGIRLFLVGVLLFLTAGFGAGSPAAAETDGPESHERFTVALLNEVDSFNPFLGIEVESYEMWALTYDTLVDFAPDDLAIEPALATEWESSEDGLTWTFTIRDDVTWSDGEPLTARDVAFTFTRVIGDGPESATWSPWLAQVTSATATDDTTVVLELKKPNGVFPMIPIPIVPEHIWKDVVGKEVRSFAVEPTADQPVVGSGPFRFVEGTAGGSTYRFEANPDYWKGAPYIDEVVYRVFKSEDPAAQALIKGEVDLVYDISALQVKSLSKQEGITAHNASSPGYDEISFNAGSIDLETGKPIGDVNPAVLDPDFRFALNFAIDRQQIVDKAYQGAGTPGSTIIPPGMEKYHWEPPADELAQDMDRAAALLDEAGYTMGSDDLRTLPDGTPMAPLRLFARADSATSPAVMAYFKEWLEELGIPAVVRTVESTKLTDIILAGDFDAFEWGWSVDVDPISMLSYMTCDQRGNWSDSWYCDEEYDALYDQQATETDPAAREEQIRQMQEILFYDAPYLVTAFNGTGEAYRSDRFACLVTQPTEGGRWLFQQGTYTYRSVRPIAQAAECGEADPTAAVAKAGTSGRFSTGFVVGLSAVLVLVAGAAGYVAGWRRGTIGDRE